MPSHTSNWKKADPSYSAWSNKGLPSNCSTWSPEPASMDIGKVFIQESTDCEQLQVRLMQQREYVENTQNFRNVGEAVEESHIVSASMNRESMGTLETWVLDTPVYSAWANVGSPSGCSNWSPSPEAVGLLVGFTQTATDCQQSQSRSVQQREYMTQTHETRNAGEPTTESRNLTVSLSRESIGSLESWATTTPTYSDWENTGTPYACSNWSPAPSTVNIGTVFTQTASDCKQDQVRNRQTREQETNTLNYRNVGAVVQETQTLLSQASTRSATGAKETWVATTPTYTSWVNTGGVYGCSNWSPDPSTVNNGTSFTQTATDCEQDQTRTRQNREQETTTLAIRNSGVAVNENQTVGSSLSRTATGTKAIQAECKYSQNSYQWMLLANTNFPLWPGVLSGNYGATTQINSGGYRYYKGALVTSVYYQICRIPL